mgnify:FL=1
MYNSSSISSLFSSLNNSSSNNYMSGINYADYNSIRNGSYRKLVKAYYAKESGTSSSNSTSKTDSTTDKTTSSQKVNAATVRDSASNLVNDVKELSSDKLWKKTTTTDKDGVTSTDYDKDAIYKAVSSFAKDYNSLVSASGNSSDNSVLRTSSTMVAYTKANKNLLSKVGITVGSDNKLTVDEDKFKSADMTTVKSLFTGRGSFGKMTSTSATSSYSSAVSQLAKLSSSSTYSNMGSYSYISGSIYDTFK